MCKKEKYEKHRNVLVFFLNLRNARYSYFSGTVLRNPKHSTQGVFDLFNCPFYSILKFNALIRKTMGTITNSNA